ncbi:aldo/keto reductase [Nocardia sp. NRRL S-836]|uniref:aldo/keto reductase n=1 Tax=Nocardia sp. NRRL S-836 TaxID=1519492 RepID=UPI0006AF3C30|nr:aldo/keto reductase [Nocardia sp. NRRL S-836]KOV83736.1 aldo/keto reductase [Nocardia sp. NRRL S-836]
MTDLGKLGFGTWAMGGPYTFGGEPVGWGPADDAESRKALRRAFELGVTLFDTADSYGCGHAETLVGQAFADVRDQVVIATKWGFTFDAATRRMTGSDGSVGHLRRAVEGSLRRLGTDRIDLYQLHLGDLGLDEAALLRDECERLVTEGKIRSYGWSTDDPERARFFTQLEHGVAAQADINVLFDNPGMYTGEYAVLCRRPLAMGLLARETFDVLPPDDVRVTNPAWLRFFVDGRPSPEYFAAREAVRDVLTSGGRTLVQGALAWFWARSPRLVPIPGVRTVAQAEENAAALEFGPLTPEQLAQVESVLR